jgi:hypothetical protein
MTYTLTASPNSVIRDADGAWIPFDPGNLDYQAYFAWLAEGNEPNPYVPPPPPVPQEISDRQFFQQAAVAGVITQAEALAAVQTGTIPAVLQAMVDAIQDADERFAATMILSGATIFERNHPLTEAIGVGAGWTSEQIDQFFMLASLL